MSLQQISDQRKSYRQIVSADDKGLLAVVVELSEKHLRRFPDDYFVWLWYAMAKTNLNQYEEAERAVRRAMSLWRTPKLELALRQMGHIFKGKGDLKTAERWYRRAARRSPERVQSYIYLGVLSFGQGQLKQAEAHFRRAIECSDGPLDEAYYNLGGVLTAQRQYAGAIACYRKAIQIDPKYSIAKRRLKDAELALHLQNPDESP